MIDINKAVSYKWPYVWDSENMVKESPVVNELLKAMIEKNVQKMTQLFSEGATINEMDEETFQRALFHLLGDYNVIKCLVDHGFVRTYGDFEFLDECIEPAAYFWGILARAWYIGNQDVFELLARNGFSNLRICSYGKIYHGEELIIKKNDVKSAVILLENGYSRDVFLDSEYLYKYPESDVIKYLQNHPVIHRKTVALDGWRFREIPFPEFEKPGFFNRKRIEERNSIIMKDYEDRIVAQERFKKELSNWEKSKSSCI